MSGVTRLLRVSIVGAFLLLLGVGPLQAAAAGTLPLTLAAEPDAIITEIQTNGGSATQEFVELYNPSADDLDLTGWKLQFFSSTGVAAGTPDWAKPATSISLSGSIQAHDYFLVSSTDYRPGDFEPDQTFSARMADTGGGLQLARATDTGLIVYDRAMWKKPASGETLPAGVWPTPAAKGSLQRVPDEDDTYWKPDGSLTDFIAAGTSSPYDKWTAPLPVVPETPAGNPVPDGIQEPAGTIAGSQNPPDTSGTAAPVATTAILNDGLAPPQITELLPNPASPLKDDTDEYIELYNPNGEPFELKGYILEVGLTTLRDYTIPGGISIPAYGYTALFSKDTRLSLTNTGSRARLLSPDDLVIAESVAYTDAPAGQAWVFNDGTWQWSTAATPGALNILAVPPATTKAVSPKSSAPKTVTAKATAVKTTTKATAKTTAAKKTAATKTTKAKAAPKPKAKKSAKAKTAKKKTTIAPVASVSQKPQRAPIHPGILVAVIGVAILYAAYEYRQDVSNQLRKLFGNRGTRQFARP